MNICIVAKYYYAERIGGAEVQAWLLACELAARGHHVSYVCESLSERGGTQDRIEGVEIHWLKYRAYFNILNLPSYARAVRRIQPTVVIHRYTSGYEWALGRYCMRQGAKFVWICTDNASPVRDRFVAMQREMLRRYPRPTYKRVLLLLHAWIKDRSRERGMRYVTHPCVQNSIQRRLFMENFGTPPFHFPSGHRIPKSVPTKQNPAIVLWVGAFSKIKRPELFLDFVKYCADLDVEFVMISKPIPKNFHTPFKPFEDYATNTPRFRWLIDVPLDETLEWFDRAGVLVCTSESEGFPNTFVQAWSRGVPVVSFGVNPNDILANPDLGRCVSSHEDARSATEAYLQEREKPGVRERRQDYARQNFSIARVADHLFDILERESPSLSD